ncbi:MAG: GGDEF domain-containing protein [Planctomycetes bacterium]|nr:GGDEF domain-containing protein [Planctomycetota bacterium]
MTELKSLALTDSEPGLFSFAQITHLMKVEFARARRYRLPLAFVVVVVDRISDLSRNFGYKARDLVLERFHAILRREVRSCDYVGRFQDDRVLLVLPHTDAEGARVLVNRVRRAVAAQEFEFEGKAFRVTLSAGISQFRDRNTLFFDSVRDAAERAAERASQAGDAVLVLEPAEPAAKS